MKIPVTVKMRLGWDDQNITAPEFARQFERAGVAAVAIHGRTRAQGFSGTVSREGIRRVVDTVERIPVIGNGDIRNIADAHRMLTETGCAGISIGRGALANPWIFQQLVAWETTGESCTGGTFSDRMGLLRKQYQFLEDRHGAERAIPVFRKMAHWYLKSMRVPAWLRDEFQTARTRSELDLAIQHIEEYGPRGAGRDEALPDMQIPVPSGPNALW